MLLLLNIFIAFFIPGILGYGGGPASIPLIENEVVARYHWLSVSEFSNILALGNVLPGPIATKMAGYIGYNKMGLAGSFAALFATIGPSLILMIFLLNLLRRHQKSPKVKKLTLLIRPVIIVMLGVLACHFFVESVQKSGWLLMIAIGVVSFIFMQRFKVNSAYVIAGSLLFGAFFMG